jgi:hypothetical protein
MISTYVIFLPDIKLPRVVQLPPDFFVLRNLHRVTFYASSINMTPTTVIFPSFFSTPTFVNPFSPKLAPTIMTTNETPKPKGCCLRKPFNPALGVLKGREAKVGIGEIKVKEGMVEDKFDQAKRPSSDYSRRQAKFKIGKLRGPSIDSSYSTTSTQGPALRARQRLARHDAYVLYLALVVNISNDPPSLICLKFILDIILCYCLYLDRWISGILDN